MTSMLKQAAGIMKRLVGFAVVGLIIGGLYFAMKPGGMAELSDLASKAGLPIKKDDGDGKGGGKDDAGADKGSSAGGSGRRGGRGGRGGGDFPTPVLAEAARTIDLPVILEGVGTAKPLNTVVVKPQVDGQILEMNFSEGQQVKKGDVLAVIDATTYKALRDQAVAKRQLTQTQLDNAQRDLARYEKVASGVVAQKTIDTQVAAVAQLEAQLKSDDAAVGSADAVLSYTKVVAPIDGRTGIRVVDVGNIVRASDSGGLVVISQIQPITVQFTLPQQQLAQVLAAMARGTVAVEAVASGGIAAVDKGTMTVVDNQVDQTTGTVKMKAEFPNAERQLWPGQFVNVRLETEKLKNVVVVPTPAVQRGPAGAFVFVVAEAEKAAMRTVTVGLQTPELTVIATGVAAGDQVITSGFGRLQDGGRVIVGKAGGGRGDGAADGAKPQAATDAAKGERKRGEGKGEGRAEGKGEGRGEGKGRGDGKGERRGKPADAAGQTGSAQARPATASSGQAGSTQ